MKFLKLILAFIWIVPNLAVSKEVNSLKHLLQIAYENNSKLKASKSQYKVEDSLITSQYSLDDPMVGISTLDRNVRTQYGTVSQKIRFPVKYFIQGDAQKKRALAFKTKIQNDKMLVRQKVIYLYYSIYGKQKIIELTNANMQAVREFARIAEKKYAAGKSPQGDSMKAHFELTQLELDLIRLRQEEESLQDELKSILNVTNIPLIDFTNMDIGVPTFNKGDVKESETELRQALKSKSPNIKKEVHLLEEAKAKSTLAKWEFAPDFQLQYQQRVAGDPSDSQIYSLSMTFPLWFWNKSAKSSAANAQRYAQEHRVTDLTNSVVAKVKDLKGKVATEAKTLKIYKTSLIPQAQGAFNSSRAAYRANKTSFLDLLDSEKSLYRVKTGFYKSLILYAKNLSALETHLGFAVSNIENIGGGRNEK